MMHQVAAVDGPGRFGNTADGVDSMSPDVSTFFSILLLALGAVAVGSMMIRFGRQSTDQRLVVIHRAAGWALVLAFFVMVLVMTERMTRHWEPLSALTTVHATLAVAMLFLLFVKVLIPRFFPGLAQHLFTIGISVFLMAFTLVGISAGYYLALKIRHIPYISHDDLLNTEVDAQRGKHFLIVKCSTCHVVRDILSATNTPQEWEKIVNRMVRLATPQITPGEARQIIYFLSTEYGAFGNDAADRPVSGVR